MPCALATHALATGTHTRAGACTAYEFLGANTLLAGLTALGFERLEVLVSPGNEPSERLARAAGFTREGVLRSYRERKGEREDFVILSLLAGEL